MLFDLKHGIVYLPHNSLKKNFGHTTLAAELQSTSRFSQSVDGHASPQVGCYILIHIKQKCNRADL
jgi:hypothetical protein